MTELTVRNNHNISAGDLPEQTTLDALDGRMLDLERLAARDHWDATLYGIKKPALLELLNRAVEQSPGLRRDALDAAQPATKTEIAMHLAALMKSVPYDGGRGEAEFFGRQLIEDVGSLQPTITGLALACRNIRRTSKFIPSIAEFLEALSSAEYRIKAVPTRLDRLERDRNDLLAEIAESERLARLKAERAARAPVALPNETAD